MMLGGVSESGNKNSRFKASTWYCWFWIWRFNVVTSEVEDDGDSLQIVIAAGKGQDLALNRTS